MKYFYVISNLSKDYVLDVQDEVQSCLEKRGAVCRYMTDYERMKNGRHTPVNMCRKIPSASSPLAVTVPCPGSKRSGRPEYPHAWDQQGTFGLFKPGGPHRGY